MRAKTFPMLATAGLVWLFAAPSQAQRYDGPTAVGFPGATAAVLDPGDPVPQIGREPCWGRCDGEPHVIRARVPSRGRSETIGASRLVVDCSGRHRGMIPSLQWAVSHAPPYATILVLPPGDGMTCVESLKIDRPLTIATFDGNGPASPPRRAVIQAPAGQPCFEANIPLGDQIVFDGIAFIARGKSEPCGLVRAGHVVMRNAEIDSRNTNWAFDVSDSGELTVDNTRIETDGAGIHAYRSLVHLRGVDIDMSPNRTDAALQLEQTDGEVADSGIIGGRWGLVGSSGPHGLVLTNVKVAAANTGIEIVAGGQGKVRIDGAQLSKNRNGIVIGPFAAADVNGSSVSLSDDAGIVVFAPDARLENNVVMGGRTGIRIARADEFSWKDVPLRPVDDPLETGVPEFLSNHVSEVGEAAIFADERAPALIVGNSLAVPPRHECIAGDRSRLDQRSNECEVALLEGRLNEPLDRGALSPGGRGIGNRDGNRGGR